MGHIIVNGMDSLITDSANSASAYSTGHKTSTGALGVYADSSPSHYDDPKHEHLMEILRRERPGCSLGIVTTADVVDATPAAFYAHTKNRSDKPVLVDQVRMRCNLINFHILDIVWHRWMERTSCQAGCLNGWRRQILS